MIRYALRCDAGHGFESWFADGATFDKLVEAGQLSCAVCGSPKVEKALMVPSLRGPKLKDSAEPAEVVLSEMNEAPGHRLATAQDAAQSGPLSAEPASAMEKAIAALRRQVEANSEYVGMNFATEARSIHAGDAPERAIHGEVRPDDARKLLEDGVPVMPLPFLPERKRN